MIRLYKIDAVDSIKKRIVESNISEKEMEATERHLLSIGYEEKNIDIEVTKTIFEEGDLIEITEEKYNALPTENKFDCRENTYAWKETQKLVDTRQAFNYMFSEKGSVKFPLTGTVIKTRVNRSEVRLGVKWHGVPKSSPMSETNVSFLEDIGFEFKEPEQEVIPILQCSDDILTDTEAVIKYMIIQMKSNQMQVENYLQPVKKAMNEAGVVFYRP